MPAHFKPIIRAKRVPEETKRALNISDISGENRLEVRNDAGKDPEIVLLGSVGKSWWDDSGISEQEVRDAIDFIPRGKKFNIRINSEGGSVQEGLGIYNALKARRDDATCYVDGYALSIASVIPLGAGKVISPRSALWMTHKAWTWAAGNDDDMEREARCLREHNETLSEIYAAETGKTKEEWLGWMKAETWIRGSKAVEFGLADEGDDEKKDDTQASSHPPIHSAYLARCKNAGAEILNAISARTLAALQTFSAPSQSGDKNKSALNAGAGNRDQLMNKTQMLALLNKWGVKVPDNATDEQILALVEAGKPEQKPAKAEGQTETASTAPTADVVALTKLIEAQNKRFEEMEKRAKAEKVGSFKRQLDNHVGETRITADEAKTILARAEKFLNLGESVEADAVVAEVAQRPIATFGAGGLGPVVQILSENPLEKIFAEKDPVKRHVTVAGDWDALIADAMARDDRGDKCRIISPHSARSGRERGLPMAANTYSATLVTSFLLDGSVTTLQHVLPSLACFSRGYDQDRYKPLATAVLKNVTAGAATQTDATNFESGGNSTVAPVSVTMHQYTQNFQVSNSDLNSGLRMADLITINAAAFGNKIIEVATAPITEANFANYNGGSYVSAPAAFGWSDMGLIWGALKKANFKNAILDGEYIAMLNNLPTFQQDSGVNGSGAMKFGWNKIECNTDWAGAGAGARGFACHPQAITRVDGLPLTPTQVGSPIPGASLSEGTITLPSLGITIAAYLWFSLSSRTLWASYDVMFGAKETDTTAGVFIKAS